MDKRTSTTIVIAIFMIGSAIIRVGMSSANDKQIEEERKQAQETAALIQKAVEGQQNQLTEIQEKAGLITYPNQASYTTEETIKLASLQAMITYNVKEKSVSGAETALENLLAYRDELEAKYA